MRPHLIAFAALAAVTADVHAQEPVRAQILHDTYCVMCHDSRVYMREDRIGRDYREIRAQVRRWQENISLRWDDQDIDRVSTHIASKYYKLNCPDEC